MDNTTIDKDPDATLDYGFDWSKWLGTDTIATSTVTVSGPDAALVVSLVSNSTTATTYWLSGGTVANHYTVTNRITTAGGRTEDRSRDFYITER